jgi:hypothetical protein
MRFAVKQQGATVAKSPKGAVWFIAVLSFVVAVVLVTATVAKGGIGSGFADAGVAPSQLAKVVGEQRACNATPPEYPGCSVAQVEAIAKGDSTEWFKKKRFGVTANNVLSGTDLTNNQIDRVMDAFAADVKDELQRLSAQAKAKGTIETRRAFTTGFRGNTYTVANFPYITYTNKVFHGDPDSGYNACWLPGTRTDGFAYQWCLRINIPQSWSYWGDFVDESDNAGSSMRLPCGKEVVLGAVGGATTGGVASIWTGPGAAAGAGIGGASGGAGGLAVCAVGHLGDLVGWWSYPKWHHATDAQRDRMMSRGLASTR